MLRNTRGLLIVAGLACVALMAAGAGCGGGSGGGNGNGTIGQDPENPPAGIEKTSEEKIPPKIGNTTCKCGQNDPEDEDPYWSCSEDGWSLGRCWDGTSGDSSCAFWGYTCWGGTCKEEPLGAGCYPKGTPQGDGTVLYCEDQEWWDPCDKIEEECKGCCESDTKLKRCSVYPEMIRPDESFNPFNDTHCWYELGDQTFDCGCCVCACDFDMSEIKDMCKASSCYAAPTPDVSQDCKDAIQQVKKSYETILSATPCGGKCLWDILDCMEASNCKGTNCGDASKCLMSCI